MASRISPREFVLLPFAFTLSSVGDIVPSARLLGAFAFLVLGGSILAYRLWFHLLRVCGATAASAYHFLMPPLGMLFAWMILGEHVELRDLMGIVPVALGIYLVTRPAAAAGSSLAIGEFDVFTHHHPDRRSDRAALKSTAFACSPIQPSMRRAPINCRM